MKRLVLVAGLVIVALGLVGFVYVQSTLKSYRNAFFYAFGPYEFARQVQEISLQQPVSSGMFNIEAFKQQYPDWQGRAYLNRPLHATELADHTSRTVTTPNNDTLYTSAVLELSSGPVELTLPAAGERYLSVALMDIFSDQFEHIGPREHKGFGGTYWIAGPEDTTPVPEGITYIRSTANDVWLLARTFVSGLDDLEAARAVQTQINVAPVFPDRPEKPFQVLVTSIDDAENFVAVTNEILSRSPSHPHVQRASRFAGQGILPSDQKTPNSLSQFQRRLWSFFAPKAKTVLEEQIEGSFDSATGWSDPPRNLGDYGTDDVTRSVVSLIGFGALRREDAIYFRMTRTADGHLLDGRKSYTLSIPSSGVPANAFWSITLYEPDETGRFFLYDNPTGRYSINSGSQELVVDENGQIVIAMSGTKPEDKSKVWMPTPDGPFAAFFRVYMPNDDMLQNGWIPPEVKQD